MNPIRKGLAIAVIFLFIAIAFLPIINANTQSNFVESITDVFGPSGGKCLIFGTGDISWLHIENLSWHFGGKYRKLYRTNLIVGNGPGSLPLNYCFFIKDLETGDTLNKDSLPRHVYLNDFFGYLRANYYCYSPHGPVGFYFTIVGFAENYYKWEH